MLRISEPSYNSLVEANALVWTENTETDFGKSAPRYYTDKLLLDEAQTELVIALSAYKIYRYVNEVKDLYLSPSGIIFPTQLNKELPKYQDIIQGERRRTIFYDRYDRETKSYLEPIIKLDYAYKRDKQGLVTEKIRTISWMLENGKWSKKTQTDVIPYVKEEDRLNEIERRRANIIRELKGLAKKFSTPKLNLEERIPEIFEKYQLEKGMYVDAGSSRFRDAIAKDKEKWLDKTIKVTGNSSREVLYSYLSIGVI